MAKLKSDKKLQQKKKATALHQEKEKEKAHTDGFKKIKKKRAQHSKATVLRRGEGDMQTEEKKRGGLKPPRKTPMM